MSANLLSIFAEDCSTSFLSSKYGLIFNDISWSTYIDKTRGFVSGKALAMSFNTVLRQTSFVSYITAEILTQIFSGLTHNISSEVNTIELIEDILSQDIVKDNEITTAKIKNKQVTDEKLSEDISKINMTTGKTFAIEQNSLLYNLQQEDTSQQLISNIEALLIIILAFNSYII